MANLLQIGSAFGRVLENIDRRAMSKALFPVLHDLKQKGDLTALEVNAAIAATAEGYPFPTNLDTDPPIGGLAPASQADLFRSAIHEGWSEAKFDETLAALHARQTA
jgi:hypothetical protein